LQFHSLTLTLCPSPSFVSNTMVFLTSETTASHRCNRFRSGIRACLRQISLRYPGVRSYSFCPCSLFIYVEVFPTVSDFCFLYNILHSSPPCMKFLSVGSDICLQLLSDSQSPTTRLLLANDIYCYTHAGLEP